jgi:hypothetical protein
MVEDDRRTTPLTSYPGSAPSAAATLTHYRARADVAPLHTQASQMPVTEAYAMDVMTVPAGLAGLPGLSVPVAVDAAHGLPLGLQLLGPRFSERCVVRKRGIPPDALFLTLTVAGSQCISLCGSELCSVHSCASAAQALR